MLQIGGAGESYPVALGGMSGESVSFEMTVTPNIAHTWVVGAKGIGYSANQTTMGGGMGSGGGSSSFAGVTARGGSSNTKYGFSTSRVLCDCIGAQCPSDLVNTNPFGGYISFIDYQYASEYSGNPAMCINPFTGQRVLGAGGSRGTTNSPNYSATMPGVSPVDGLGGGAASCKAFQPIGTSLYASNATSPGCGGGFCYLHIDSQNSNASGLARGGDGADGAVYVYVRGE